MKFNYFDYKYRTIIIDRIPFHTFFGNFHNYVATAVTYFNKFS